MVTRHKGCATACPTCVGVSARPGSPSWCPESGAPGTHFGGASAGSLRGGCVRDAEHTPTLCRDTALTTVLRHWLPWRLVGDDTTGPARAGNRIRSDGLRGDLGGRTPHGGVEGEQDQRGAWSITISHCCRPEPCASCRRSACVHPAGLPRWPGPARSRRAVIAGCRWEGAPRWARGELRQPAG